MLSEYITSLFDVSFLIVASMYVRFRYSGKDPMRLAVFWRISVRFCGFTPPSNRAKMRTEKERRNGRTKRTELCLVYVL